MAAIVQLLPIQSNTSINSVASAIRNVCNATLSLLFTAALFIWGLLVNRKQAWRTDGGTAAFGAAALVLAIVSTALNFLYVPREEEYVWLPGLMWAVVLWQSFLGWWWWVGAGSGTGLAPEEDEMVRRAKRELRRTQVREKRQETKERAKMVWRGLAGALVHRQPHHTGERPARPDDSLQGSESDGRNSDQGAVSPPASPTQSTHTPSSAGAPGDHFSGSTSSLNTSTATSGTLPRFLPSIVHQWYASLRHAHLLAARRQTAERAARIRELEIMGNANARSGWGLGSFALRPHGAKSFELHEGNARHRSRDAGPVGPEPEERPVGEPDDRNRPRSIWWWGPLGRWRLQDSTVY